MDISTLATGGGIAGIILASVHVGRLWLDWRREKRAAPREETAASVTDAAAANAILKQTLDSLQAENRRMSAKIKHLEREAEEKDAKISDLETRLSRAQADFSRELDQMRSELAALKRHV